MKVKCELLNSFEDKTAHLKLPVIIEDNGVLSNEIKISIGETVAVVRADELEKAVDACTRLPY